MNIFYAAVQLFVAWNCCSILLSAEVKREDEHRNRYSILLLKRWEVVSVVLCKKAPRPSPPGE
jgi:dsDNA-binding SOS-regulon protein